MKTEYTEQNRTYITICCQLSEIIHNNNNNKQLCFTYIIPYFDTYDRTHNGDESPKDYKTSDSDQKYGTFPLF